MAHVLTKVEAGEAVDTSDIAAIAKELGLPVQESRYTARYDILRDFTPLSDDEALVWSAFCPTAYRAGLEGGGLGGCCRAVADGSTKGCCRWRATCTTPSLRKSCATGR